MDFITLRKEWTSNFKGDILAGIVVALALIPEAIAFSIIAGVDPSVGLYASFTMAVVIAIVGGRPGMVSAATGAMALLMVYLVKNHGIEYLFAAGILTGILQIIWGFLKIGHQMKYVPRAVLVGFVNALAILIFMAQLPQFNGVGWQMYVLVALGLAIIYLLPRVTKAVPSPLVAIIVLTLITVTFSIEVPTVGDMGQLPESLPAFHLPQVPLNGETLAIIFPTALTMSIVGLLESFLTASVIDDLTDTTSDKNREAKGQGIANLITSFFGGMAGCAMIGQSVINIKSGGRQRLSTFSAGVLLLTFMVVLGPYVERIPMAALVAVMIMVSIGTFNWGYLLSLRRMPKSETAVMLATVTATIITHNLAIGVLLGVALSTLFFSRKIAQLVFITSGLSENGLERTYYVCGQIFFVSVGTFLEAFNFSEELEFVVVDLSQAHLWDQSAVVAIDKVVLKFRRKGADVKLVGLNEASATLLDKLAVHDKLDAFKDLAAH
ncbi:MAG: SulP family inorganic anion transporter [Leptolyngbyaceae bacterium]|nr:SulP family inorganic anion transporter [Leptolyngbyaceae bacterium]